MTESLGDRVRRLLLEIHSERNSGGRLETASWLLQGLIATVRASADAGGTTARFEVWGPGDVSAALASRGFIAPAPPTYPDWRQELDISTAEGRARAAELVEWVITRVFEEHPGEMAETLFLPRGSTYDSGY